MHVVVSVGGLEDGDLRVHHIKVIERAEHARVGAEGHLRRFHHGVLEVEVVPLEEPDHRGVHKPSSVPGPNVVHSVVQLDNG